MPAKSSTQKVASHLGETKTTTTTKYVSEGRKDVLISGKTEATMFKTLRYYNWSKSFGMKTDFANKLSDGTYSALQTLNDISAFVTSDSLVRSIAARYGWVVAGRFFGKIQGKVLPQGGGPFGRFMRVKGGQFSRKVLGNFMNYFTTTEMKFENVTKTQRAILKELQAADSTGPTWAGMALAEAVTTAPDPFATQANQVMKGGRQKTIGKAAGYADREQGKTESYLSKRTDVLQKMSQSGMSAPEMTYLIKAMEQGGDPDDIMAKYQELNESIASALSKHAKFNPKEISIDKWYSSKQAKTHLGTVTEYRDEIRQESVPINEEYIAAYMPIYAKNNSTRQSVLRDVPVTIAYDVPSERGTGSRTMFDEDLETMQQQRVNEILSEALGIDLYDGPMQVFETFFGGSDIQLGPKELKHSKTSKTTELEWLKDSKGKRTERIEKVTGGTLKDETGAYSQIDSQIDHHNYREVRSSSNIMEHNYIASRPQIVKGLRIIDGKNLHKKNPKGVFLVYGIELAGHKGIRDIQQIEYGGPATDRSRGLKLRTDRYIYPRSMFVHKAAQTAANKLGIEADLKFSKRRGDVMGTIRQRRTKAIANYQKDKNQSTAKNGGYTLMVDNRVREVLKRDLIAARNPRLTDGNKVHFGDMKVSDNVFQAGAYNRFVKGADHIDVIDETGNMIRKKIDQSDYPPEFKNAFDKLRQDLRKNLKPISGDMPLSDEYYLSSAFAKSDARRRQTQHLSNDLGKNEFGNRRQLDPTQLRRQNFRVRGGVWRTEDIVDQAIAEAQEELFPQYMRALSIGQTELEKRLAIEADAKMAALKKEKLSGEELRRRKIQIEEEIDAMYQSGYAVVQQRAWDQTIGDLVSIEGKANVNHPIIQEKLKDINDNIEQVIRGSGNRSRSLMPFAPVIMKSKYTKYHNALMKGDKGLADEIFAEITNGGKIKMRAIENQIGFKFQLVGHSAGTGNPIYRRVALESTTLAPVSREEILNPPETISNFRDIRNIQIEGNAGLNEVRGVGGNVNKGKTNLFGNPTSDDAIGNINKVKGGLGNSRTFQGTIGQSMIGNRNALKDLGNDGNFLSSAENITDAVNAVLEDREVLRAYKAIRSYVNVHGPEHKQTGNIGGGGGAGFEALHDKKGKGSPAFKSAVANLSDQIFSSDDKFLMLHFILIFENNDHVIKEIYDIFDPNSDYGMKTSGQSTVREGHSVGDRFLTVGRNRQLDITHINRMRAEIKNTSASLHGNDNYLLRIIKDAFFL